jgi:prepilin-type N-terminal cleavage/methylation domain-containing protein
VSERISMDRELKFAEQSGFSLLEMMISIAILVSVAGVVMSGLLQTTHTEGTVQNRTEMHAGVRSATELMQQEVGEAGRVALPNIANIQLTSAVTTAGPSSPSVTSGATAGMFVNEYLVVDTGSGYGTTFAPGSNQETVQVTAISGDTFTANFNLLHASGAPVAAHGGFGTGIMPESASPYSWPNGSDGTHLKLYGDINGDGNMVYVEYICDYAGSGNLYRSVTPYGAGTIVAKQILLPNLVSTGNPGGTACFVYQERPIGCSYTSTPCFVVDVAVTLTVQTQQPDPSTGQYQQETKALLNVSPRNVFDAYELSTLNNNRVQPTPSTVTALLSQTP